MLRITKTFRQPHGCQLAVFTPVSYEHVQYCKGHQTVPGGYLHDASTKRPLPVLILPFKTSLIDFIPDNHKFQVKITLV
jgi:hypothetical protein